MDEAATGPRRPRPASPTPAFTTASWPCSSGRACAPKRPAWPRCSTRSSWAAGSPPSSPTARSRSSRPGTPTGGCGPRRCPARRASSGPPARPPSRSSVRLPDGDPLHGLPAGQQAGLVIVEFAARRRVRVNGTLTVADDDILAVEVEQGYGNCPQYINQRVLTPVAPGQDGPAQGGTGQGGTGRGGPGQGRTDPGDVAQGDAAQGGAGQDGTGPGRVRRGTALASADIELVRAADTFFLGTTNPERGSDASHRAAGRDSSASTATGSGGRTTRATSCSTRSATSPSTPRRPCSSPTSPPAARSTCQAPRRSSGTRRPARRRRAHRAPGGVHAAAPRGRLLSSRQVGGYRPYPLSPPLTG